MKIALIGYGVMGKLIERIAVQRGHEISAKIDEPEAGLTMDELASRLSGADVAIEFSIPDAVERNIAASMKAGVPLVEGTTGWNDRIDAIRLLVEKNEGGFVYGANFSIGVNLFYHVVRNAAQLFSKFDDYEVFIEEQHHSRKLDAPSGTALKIKDIVDESYKHEYSVSSTRAGNIPGTHRVGFDGTADQVLLEHAARSREGFAAGAVMAAEWVIGKKGFWEFSDVIDDVIVE
ncbi:MAG: dihydrodipicolinate reductase [Acidobacteriota bacterium]|nr:dihydrodipicolinate reductase [Acidobacteriota bacterium]MDH3530035.1 dihydrodipicolinate reductase [Acidobacteriota bacterium]